MAGSHQGQNEKRVTFLTIACATGPMRGSAKKRATGLYVIIVQLKRVPCLMLFLYLFLLCTIVFVWLCGNHTQHSEDYAQNRKLF